jgi:hypothetical protein
VPDIPKIQVEYSPKFNRIVIGGLFGSIQSFGLEAFVYSNHLQIDEVIATEPASTEKTIIKRTIECELLADPIQMKSMYNWLGTKIEEYEKPFGMIPSLQDIQSKAQGKSSEQSVIDSHSLPVRGRNEV